MLTLMYACGLRVSELVSLPEHCINFEKKQILVRGKGSKERMIPVADKALAAISEYYDYRELFFERRPPFDLAFSFCFQKRTSDPGRLL